MMFTWQKIWIIFKLTSTDIIWKVSQILLIIDCAMHCFKYEWTLAMYPFLSCSIFIPYPPLIPLIPHFCYFCYCFFLLLWLQIMLCFVCLCAIVYLCNMRYTKAVVGTEVQYLSDDPQKTQTGSFICLFFVSAICLCNLFEYYNILCTNWRINLILVEFRNSNWRVFRILLKFILEKTDGTGFF